MSAHHLNAEEVQHAQAEIARIHELADRAAEAQDGDESRRLYLQAAERAEALSRWVSATPGLAAERGRFWSEQLRSAYPALDSVAGSAGVTVASALRRMATELRGRGVPPSLLRDAASLTVGELFVLLVQARSATPESLDDKLAELARSIRSDR